MSSTTTRHRPSSALLLDIALAVFALAVSLALIAHGGIDTMRLRSAIDTSRHGSASLDLTGVVLAACSTVPLIAWRRFPLGVFVLTATASVLLAGLGYPLDVMLGPAAALFLLAASRGSRSPWTWHTTVAVAGPFVAYLGATAAAQGTFPGTEMLHSSLAWAVAWFAGERTRLRREHIAELQDRLVRTERDAERERLLAATEERTRIARDLHDSAGHAISVIAVRAGAARLRHHEDPDRSRVALEAIEELARQTVEEIEEIIGTLRADSPATGAIEAPSGLASLDTLITRHVEAGLEVTVDTTGAPRSPGRASDQAAYRILQEALTNAARHGAGRARIELAYGDTAVDLIVTNPVSAQSAPRSAGGHGLIGMRERATLLGGSLDAAPANGSFRVHAWIPYGGHRP